MINFFKHAKVYLLILFVAMGTSLWAQRITVTGTVKDNTGEPLVGASIIEKASTSKINGTAADIEGKYSLNVERGSTLVFSSIGFVTKEIVVTSAELNVVLELDSQLLEDVVVVGYGVQKKSSVTGAISQVKSEDMLNRSITRPEQALQGKTAGVQVYQSSASPGSSPQIRIRGINSNGSCDPLYVVDGRITSNIGGIDPNDIESMEVLKDAASAAIYGSSAGNGVILITTKKGKKGEGTITYDFQMYYQDIANIPKVMNAEQYIDFMTEANYIQMDNIVKNWDFKTNTNWAKETFETSFFQKHNLSFQGGGDSGSYYLSMSYLDNNGYVKGDADIYKRLTLTVNGEFNVKKWLQVGSNNQIEYYERRAVQEGSEYGSMLVSVLQLDPLTAVTYSPDNLPEHMQIALGRGYNMLKDENGNYYGTSAYQETENYNPFIMRDKTQSTSKGFNVSGVVYGNLKPIKGLTITSRLGYRLAASKSYSVNNDCYVNATVKQDNISVSASCYAPLNIQWENFANYTNTWNNKHSVNAMIGASYIENINFGVSGSISGDRDIAAGTGDVGFIKDDPLYLYFAYATATAIKSISGGEETFGRKLSYFGRAGYDYMGKYILQASLRADAADLSVLPTNERWGYFPAVSLGWVASNEKFLQNAKSWLSYLKVRASWGQNGSTSSLGGYSYASVIGPNGSYPFYNTLQYSSGVKPTTTGNYNLRWETSEQIDLGIDARFFKDRLSVGFDYFSKKTKDLIMTGVTTSTIVGNTASPINAGNIDNNGVELELGWRDNIGDFSYSIRGNVATINNKVNRIHESLERINGAGFHTTSGITAFETGYPAWYFRGYKCLGIDSGSGNPIFYDKDDNGVINDADKVQLGSGLPKATYGITINAAYKGFDLTIFGTGSVGNDIFSCLNRGDRLQANMLTEFTEDRWTPTNTGGSRPRVAATDIDKYWISDAVVFDGSYFKIKQLQLGYTLPKSVLNSIKLKNARVYCSLDDYFTFTSYPGFDPEVTGVGASLGVDKGVYPSSKKVVFGLNITF